MIPRRLVRLFTSKIKENEMVIVEFGYTQYVLSAKDALVMSEILERAELYEKKWIPVEDRVEGSPNETVHVYMNDREISMRIIGNSLYQMAKLAGKPK
jgi:hypothetical protein